MNRVREPEEVRLLVLAPIGRDAALRTFPWFDPAF